MLMSPRRLTRDEGSIWSVDVRQPDLTNTITRRMRAGTMRLPVPIRRRSLSRRQGLLPILSELGRGVSNLCLVSHILDARGVLRTRVEHPTSYRNRSRCLEGLHSDRYCAWTGYGAYNECTVEQRIYASRWLRYVEEDYKSSIYCCDSYICVCALVYAGRDASRIAVPST